MTAASPAAGRPPARVVARPSWPAPLQEIFARFLTCEYATLTRAGTPITWPVTPYVGERTIDVSCGLAYPSKAERARRDARVALAFSSPAGSGLHTPHVVLVQGLATVRDADLLANTDRYLAAALDKLHGLYEGIPVWLLERLLDWYWPRIWVEVTPLRMAWWTDGDLHAAPGTWAAPANVTVPASDPAPMGPALGAWTTPPSNVAARLDAALTLGRPVVTITDADGWPLPVPAQAVGRTGPRALEVTLPAAVEPGVGPVCLTFHAHPERFDRQQNAVLVGRGHPLPGGRLAVDLDRALGDFSLPGGPARQAITMLRARRRLRPRLAAEARRRGQAVPTVRVPRSHAPR